MARSVSAPLSGDLATSLEEEEETDDDGDGDTSALDIVQVHLP